jgi:probable addiction module antidote protein
MKPSKLFATTRKKLLHDPKIAAAYLEECLQDGNMELFTAALKHVAEAQGGVGALSKSTKLNREALYRTLSHDGNPRLDTLSKVLGAMGLRIAVVAADARS